MGTIIESCAKAADKVRDICPLVHCITNYVTVNDVANCILAIGASPIMADDIAEAADITSISKALVKHGYSQCKNGRVNGSCWKESQRAWRSCGF